MIDPHEIQFDFEAEIRIRRENEGGRKSPASNGVRWDLGYAEDKVADGLWMIHPWFLSPSGDFLDFNVKLPVNTLLTARMYVLDDYWRTRLHQTKARVGTRFYCHEGHKRVAEGRITRILDLHKEREESGSARELDMRPLREAATNKCFGGCHLMTSRDQGDGVIPLRDGRFQLISGGEIAPLIVCHDVILLRSDIAAILSDFAPDCVTTAPAKIYRRRTDETFATHSRLSIAQRITWEHCGSSKVDWPLIALLGNDQVFVQPALRKALLDAGFDCLDFEPSPLYAE